MMLRRFAVFTLTFLVFMTIYLVASHDFTSYELRRERAEVFLQHYGYTQPQIARILDAK